MCICVIHLCISKFALKFLILWLIFTFVKMLMHRTPYSKVTKYMETAKKNLVKDLPAVTGQLLSSNPASRCIYIILKSAVQILKKEGFYHSRYKTDTGDMVAAYI